MQETSYIIIALLTSIIGGLVRIAKELHDKAELKRSKIVLILFCALAVGYLTEGLVLFLCRVKDYNLYPYVGHIGILGGIVSVEVIDILIVHIPSVFKKYLNK